MWPLVDHMQALWIPASEASWHKGRTTSCRWVYIAWCPTGPQELAHSAPKTQPKSCKSMQERFRTRNKWKISHPVYESRRHPEEFANIGGEVRPLDVDPLTTNPPRAPLTEADLCQCLPRPRPPIPKIFRYKFLQ